MESNPTTERRRWSGPRVALSMCVPQLCTTVGRQFTGLVRGRCGFACGLVTCPPQSKISNKFLSPLTAANSELPLPTHNPPTSSLSPASYSADYVFFLLLKAGNFWQGATSIFFLPAGTRTESNVRLCPDHAAKECKSLPQTAYLARIATISQS